MRGGPGKPPRMPGLLNRSEIRAAPSTGKAEGQRTTTATSFPGRLSCPAVPTVVR